MKIILILLASCLVTNCKINKQKEDYFGVDEMSNLKDYIELNPVDTSYISWRFFNEAHFGGLTVYPIDSLKNKLKFFAIDEKDKQIVLYFENETYYLFELSKVVKSDSVRILIN